MFVHPLELLLTTSGPPFFYGIVSAYLMYTVQPYSLFIRGNHYMVATEDTIQFIKIFVWCVPIFYKSYILLYCTRFCWLFIYSSKKWVVYWPFIHTKQFFRGVCHFLIILHIRCKFVNMRQKGQTNTHAS